MSNLIQAIRARWLSRRALHRPLTEPEMAFLADESGYPADAYGERYIEALTDPSMERCVTRFCPRVSLDGSRCPHHAPHPRALDRLRYLWRDRFLYWARHLDTDRAITYGFIAAAGLGVVLLFAGLVVGLAE